MIAFVLTLFVLNELVCRITNSCIRKINSRNQKDKGKVQYNEIQIRECYLSSAYIISTVFSISLCLCIYEGQFTQSMLKAGGDMAESIVCIILILFANILSTAVANVIIDNFDSEVRSLKKQKYYNFDKNDNLFDKAITVIFKKPLQEENERLHLSDTHSDCRLLASILVLIFLIINRNNQLPKNLLASYVLAFVSSFVYYDTTVFGFWNKIRRLISPQLILAVGIFVILLIWIKIIPEESDAIEGLALRSFFLLAFLGVSTLCLKFSKNL